MKKLIMAVAISAIVVSGCVSVESTRAQLNSNNPQEVKNAEDTIYTVVTTGKDKTGFVQFTTEQQVEYVKLTSNQDLLLRIIDDAHNGDVIAAAIERLDFSKKGEAKSFVLQRFRQLSFWVKDEKEAELKSSIVSRLTQDELLDLIGDRKTNEERRKNDMSPRGGRDAPIEELDFDDRDMLIDRLIATTDSPTTLWRMYNDEIHVDRYKHKPVAKKQLLTMLDNVSDEKMIEKMLVEWYADDGYFVNDVDKRILLLTKLPESKMVEIALQDIDKHSLYRWNEGDLVALESAIGITAHIKNPESVVKLVTKVLATIAAYREECKNSWTMRWDGSDEAKAKKLIGSIPKLTDAEIAMLVCFNESTWKYLIDKVTPDNAYNILTQGKAMCDELEVALIKKLPQQKVDMKVFAGVRTDAGKKAVMAAMPDDVKKSAQESTEKMLASIMEKAKEASKNTFEIHGFYLGMDWEDMKIVLSHHFPDYEIKELRDGDAKDADYVVYVANQKAPFCYASAKEKKVYQFNFGKKMLKKWYKYDVQTYMEWAHAYERENKIDMKFKLVEKDTTVYEPDMSRSYRVWFHQESYQYKHNTKEYRLTYFGEEKDFTFEGGIGGAIIKEMAAPRFRYVRGDPGSLRAVIERD